MLILLKLKMTFSYDIYIIYYDQLIFHWLNIQAADTMMFGLKHLFIYGLLNNIYFHCPFVQIKKYSTPSLQFFMKFNTHFVFHTLLKNKVFNSHCTV